MFRALRASSRIDLAWRLLAPLLVLLLGTGLYLTVGLRLITVRKGLLNCGASASRHLWAR